MKRTAASSGMDIPEYVYETLARCVLPQMEAFYSTLAGQKAFQEWKSKQKSESNAR